MQRSHLAALALALACGHEQTGAEGSSSSSTGEGLAPPDGYWLPLACGTQAVVGQGNHGEFSHHGDLQYAFDLLLALDTPVHAMAEGIVLYTYSGNQPGDPCHDGGDQSCVDLANLVVLRHGDGTRTLYKHLETVAVSAGATVPRGGVVGRSGSTGWSTRPHLHVMRMSECEQPQCPSIPLAFVDVAGAGVPVTGDGVTATNCP